MPDDVEIKAIAIKGSFTAADWKELAHTIRHIERRHPDQMYQVCILDSNVRPIADAEEVLRMFPMLPSDDTRGVRPLHEILDEILKH